MQFIKNNKLYDTNTAKKLACASEYIRMPAGEANIFKNHNLFKKKTGEFFLFHTRTLEDTTRRLKSITQEKE